MEWLRGHGVETKDWTVKEFAHEGNGIVALREFKKGETICRVPRSAALTVLDGAGPDLTRLVREGHKKVLTGPNYLERIPSLALTTRLLTERYAPASKWRPYLDLLPNEGAETPLRWNPDEIKMLSGTPTMLCKSLVDYVKFCLTRVKSVGDQELGSSVLLLQLSLSTAQCK